MASKEARDAAIKRAAEIVRNDHTGLISRPEIRVELLAAPERLIVRTHEELPRDPERPHFVQTRPVDHVYVRQDT